MTVYKSIIKGLGEAIEYEKSNLKNIRARTIRIAPLPHFFEKDIRDIRIKLGLSQSAFAGLMGVSIKTIEAWESGRNVPQGPAQRMLELLQKDATLVKNYVHVGCPTRRGFSVGEEPGPPYKPRGGVEPGKN